VSTTPPAPRHSKTTTSPLQTSSALEQQALANNTLGVIT
jgi:hypothetical protein